MSSCFPNSSFTIWRT